MPVVSNTSPISYLVLIGEVDVLPALSALYGEIWIPDAVQKELAHPRSPAQLRAWIRQPPAWLQVEKVASEMMTLEEEAFAQLDVGEREALLLTQKAQARLVILDERPARAVAKSKGFTVTGTLGVLDAAAEEGLVDVAGVVKRLRKTSFRASPALYQWLLERHS